MTQTVAANELVTSVLAVLNTRLSALTPPRTAYDLDDAPKEGGDYVTVSLTRDDGGNQRVGPHIVPSMWSLEVEAVGTYVSNVRLLLHESTQAVEHVSVTVDGVESTPIKFESESRVREDYPHTSLFSADRGFTFAF